MPENQDKPVYEQPKVLMLDKGNAAIGDCETGSGDLGCTTGHIAYGCYSVGETAGDTCSAGNGKE